MDARKWQEYCDTKLPRNFYYSENVDEDTYSDSEDTDYDSEESSENDDRSHKEDSQPIVIKRSMKNIKSWRSSEDINNFRNIRNVVNCQEFQNIASNNPGHNLSVSEDSSEEDQSIPEKKLNSSSIYRSELFINLRGSSSVDQKNASCNNSQESTNNSKDEYSYACGSNFQTISRSSQSNSMSVSHATARAG